MSTATTRCGDVQHDWKWTGEVRLAGGRYGTWKCDRCGANGQAGPMTHDGQTLSIRVSGQ